jgi:putative transposase
MRICAGFSPYSPQFPLDFEKSGASLRRTAEGGCSHTSKPMRQAFYRRQLPHLQCDDKQHFVTFCTDHRWILPEHLRSTVLECCLHDNGFKFDLRVAVVMPDHIHMIFTPLVNQHAMEVYSLGQIMNAIKGASAHMINKMMSRKGRVWQPESFDHVLRSSENLDAKIIYVLENPVRRGLVGEWAEYRWIWRKAERIRLLLDRNVMVAAAAGLRPAEQPGAAVPT